MSPQQDVIPDRAPIPFTAPVKEKAESLGEATVEDLDRLWDWARSDREAVASFLGANHANSQGFFRQIGSIYANEQGGIAWFRAVRVNGELVGFVMLNPIVPTASGQAATVHMYFVPKTDNGVLRGVIELLPSDMTLMMVAPNELFAQTFAALGFESKIVLTRPASASTGGTSSTP